MNEISTSLPPSREEKPRISLRSRRARAVTFAGLALAIGLSSSSASAVVRFWNDGGAGNNYATPENWSGNAVPGSGDLAVHNNGNLSPIAITSNVSADSLRLSDGGSVNHTAGELIIAAGGDQGLWIGEFGPRTSTYTFNGGSIVLNDSANSFDVGREGGATGVFTMNGGTITNNGVNDAFFVGRFGGSTGTFNLTGGTINGPTTDTHIGLDGTATWNQSGGTFNAAGVQIGRFASPTAEANLSGNAVWNSHLVLLADGSAGIGSAVSAQLNVIGPDVSFNSLGLVVRSKGSVNFDGQGVGLSTLNLNGQQLLLDNATLTLANLPSLGSEIILFDNIGSYTGQATFANAPQGFVFENGWSIDYRDHQIALVPEPSVVGLGLGLCAGLLVWQRRRRSLRQGAC